ncbi:MAG TPA: 16S rRNA (guanine(966)-N(2))-methyltransferase RsmD [Syntrophorhabdaceae bacterium]|nr:16S rRNA (guanine(966)-N(2))-methyltransferase RsmD [Syntrophorhabdaceae bacterium]
MDRLRIIGGAMKGRCLRLQEGAHARYTSSKVRGSIFNMLDDVTDKKILDLYAGSGILAIESISRGAGYAVMVEIDKKTAIRLRENIKNLDLEDRCSIMNMDVKDAIPLLYKTGSLFDIIFMDPPYERGYVRDTMMLLRGNSIYNRDTSFVIETSKREDMGFMEEGGWMLVTRRQYGDTVVSIFRNGFYNSGLKE